MIGAASIHEVRSGSRMTKSYPKARLRGLRAEDLLGKPRAPEC
jgi:hypothetical protein